MYPSAVAEILLDAVRNNLRLIRRQAPTPVRICPAVKANAYGHGVAAILPVLRDENVDCLAVANLNEALELRRLDWNRPILVLGAPLVGDTPADVRDRAAEILAADLQASVSSLAEAQSLSQEAVRRNRMAIVHVKIDSGMGRMGLLADAAADELTRIAALPGLKLESIYTHLATADAEDTAFVDEQLAAFARLRTALAERNLRVPLLHAASSAAIFRAPAAHLDMVRPGLCLYGYWCGPTGTRPEGLRPAMRVVSRIAALRDLPTGHSVGYGRTYTTSRPSRIGVVPIGYADGYRRGLSNNAVMTIERPDGSRAHAPVVGRVSMDQVSIDVTDVPGVSPGSRVIVLDDDPSAPNSVEATAARLGTIPYEVTCGLGPRVTRVPL